MATPSSMINLLFFFLLQSVYLRYTYTQLPQNVFFSPSTPQLRILTELSEEEQGQQYTLWGWFRFNGETPAISNLISMRNLTVFKDTTNTTKPFPDPNFPVCPVSQDDLKINPTLVTQANVANNPNCFPDKNQLDKVDTKKIQNKGPELLYINFDLSPPQGNKQLFALIFLLQNGKTETGNSDMKLEGFTDVELVKNSWSYFGISADYKNGSVNIFFFSFNNIMVAPETKTFEINFPDFKLTKTVELIVAGVELNPYFQSTSGFIGNISAVEMGLFYTDLLELLWMGFMAEDQYNYDSALIELFFDIYNDQQPVNSKGLLNIDYEITGPHEAIYNTDKNRTGVKFGNNSSISLNNVDFGNVSGLVRTFAFYFHIEYNETLPEEFVLLTRGDPTKSGYIKVSLKKTGTGRVVSLTAKGDTQEIKWQSVSILLEKTEFKFIIGISISPADSVRLVYWDQNGIRDFNELTKNFIFDRSALPVVLLDNKTEDAFTGKVSFYHFKALNSVSSLIFSQLIDNNKTKNFESTDPDCLLPVGYYKQTEGCFLCKTKIADETRNCADYCPLNTKNVFIDNCINCSKEFCEEIDRTHWLIEPIDSKSFRIKPSRKIPNFNDIKDEIVLNLESNKKNVPFEQTINPEEQYIDIKVKHEDNLIKDKILVKVKPESKLVLFDENKNLISPQAAVFDVPRYCYIERTKSIVLKVLAYVSLALFFLSFIILLLMTFLKYNQIEELGALWKFMLHNWMKLQLIAFLLLLALYVPCCVKEFLNPIYNVVVSWNHGLSSIINNSNTNDVDFKKGIDSTAVPLSFNEKGIEIFLLHNIGVSFIVHLLIFLFYVIVKIGDCLITSNSSCMYKTFNWMEFTVLIIGYLLVEMHVFVFSFFNFRLVMYNHTYFIFCFIIAIFYTAIFILFWLFCLIKILGSAVYFVDKAKYSKFIYFLTGYKENKWARSYDLWLLISYFFIGLFIGLLIYSPLTQIILIFAVLVFLLAVSVIFRPWNFFIIQIIDIISQVLILFSALVFLIIGSYDQSECYDCGGREGVLCWLIVICLFLAMLIMFIGHIIATIMSIYAKDKFRSKKHKRVIVDEKTEVINIIEDDRVYNKHVDEEYQKISHNEDNNERNKALMEEHRQYQTNEYYQDNNQNKGYEINAQNNLQGYETNVQNNLQGYETNAQNNLQGYKQEIIEVNNIDVNRNNREVYDNNQYTNKNYYEENNIYKDKQRLVDKDIVRLRESDDFKQSKSSLKPKNIEQFIQEERTYRNERPIYRDSKNSQFKSDPYQSNFSRRRSLSRENINRTGMKGGNELQPDEADDTYMQEVIHRTLSESNLFDPDNTFKKNYSRINDDSGIRYKSRITNKSNSIRYLKNLEEDSSERINRIMLEDNNSLDENVSYGYSVYSHNRSKSDNKGGRYNVFERSNNKENLQFSSQFRSNDFYKSKKFDDPY